MGVIFFIVQTETLIAVPASLQTDGRRRGRALIARRDRRKSLRFQTQGTRIRSPGSAKAPSRPAPVCADASTSPAPCPVAARVSLGGGSAFRRPLGSRCCHRPRTPVAALLKTVSDGNEAAPIDLVWGAQRWRPPTTGAAAVRLPLCHLRVSLSLFGARSGASRGGSVHGVARFEHQPISATLRR